MSDAVIIVENLGKKYRIRHEQRERYTALRDVLARSVTGFGSSVLGAGRHLFGLNGSANSNHFTPDRLTSDLRPLTSEDFWALRNVSFEVKRGEVVGIIGRNGAGKSTLLKILSRITEPTEGRVRIKGRVASLLEVGTGFHPELTGRENIFLNGAILGMTREEIKRKFDEIVAFAEIEKFLDTPVKRYSSGMYVRLAFAVAAHLEPEILLVDEVLAVGDASFQEKCIGKLDNLSTTRSRTVFFVSHNLSVLHRLCRKGLLLDSGILKMYEPIDPVVAEYLKVKTTAECVDLSKWRDRITNGDARIVNLSINGSSTRDGVVLMSTDLMISFSVDIYKQLRNPSFGILIQNSFNDFILDLRSSNHGFRTGVVSGKITVSVTVKELGLLPGKYIVSPWINDEAEKIDLDYVKSCGAFTILEGRGDDVVRRFDPRFAKYWLPSSWSVTSQ